MMQDVRIDPGAAVEATDGRLGTVDEVVVRPDDGGLAYIVVRRGWSNEQLLVPADLIRAIEGPREVKLGVSRDEARERAAGVPGDALLLARDRGSEVVIPIVEERLVPDRKRVHYGELRLHKLVDEVEESVRENVTRDDLVLERVPVNQPIAQPASARYEGDWLVIPIMREELVVTKRLMLVEEVRISKREIVEEQEVREVTRHERLDVEDATTHGVAGLDALANGVSTTSAAHAASDGAAPGPTDTDEPRQSVLGQSDPDDRTEPLPTFPPAAGRNTSTV